MKTCAGCSSEDVKVIKYGIHLCEECSDAKITVLPPATDEEIRRLTNERYTSHAESLKHEMIFITIREPNPDVKPHKSILYINAQLCATLFIRDTLQYRIDGKMLVIRAGHRRTNARMFRSVRLHRLRDNGNEIPSGVRCVDTRLFDEIFAVSGKYGRVIGTYNATEDEAYFDLTKAVVEQKQKDKE